MPKAARCSAPSNPGLTGDTPFKISPRAVRFSGEARQKPLNFYGYLYSIWLSFGTLILRWYGSEGVNLEEFFIYV